MSVDMDAYGRQFLEDYENGDFEVILIIWRLWNLQISCSKELNGIAKRVKRT